jgi:hypothetical protein
MKNFKLRILLFSGLIAIAVIIALLFPLAIILIVFKPKHFQYFLLKLVNSLRLLDWLYDLAVGNSNYNSNEI